MPPTLPTTSPDSPATPSAVVRLVADAAATTTAASPSPLSSARPADTLVLFAHPNPRISRINRKLAEAAALIDGVDLDDLYETYPDFDIDVARERQRISAASLLVLVFPLQWYAAPALLKEWFDIVLADAWQRDRVRPSASGARRRCWLVVSTGSSAADYAAGARHGRPLADFLAPYEQSARVCGMEWLEPLACYSAHDIDSAAVDAHVARFAERLRQLSGAPIAPQSLAAGGSNGV